MVKRKRFTRDGPARREDLTSNIHIPGPLEEYIHRTLGHGVAARRLPTFRRVRYDINIESLNSGNVYTVLFDHCHLTDEPATTLVQCEVEYISTRSFHQPRPQTIHTEFDTLTTWLTSLATEHHNPSAPCPGRKLRYRLWPWAFTRQVGTR